MIFVSLKLLIKIRIVMCNVCVLKGNTSELTIRVLVHLWDYCNCVELL